MATLEQRRRMAAAILDFEARRDKQGHLAVYRLPKGDGGGTYEVAGINDGYHKDVADVLVSLIKAGRFDEAETVAIDFIGEFTDRAAYWSEIPALEFYLRDSVFNRGPNGGARILQRALGVKDDGVVGPGTRAALASAEADVSGLLKKLRAAREDYERKVVGRDEASKFWKGLVKRWNKAVEIAVSFPMTKAGSTTALMAPLSLAATFDEAIVPELPVAAVLSALRVGMRGPRVAAWQSFLVGRGFDPGVVDGVFGEHTRDATKKFQASVKIAEDGVAGRETLLKAAALGLELIEEPADDATSSNFPPRPGFAPLVSNAQRAAVFGGYDFLPAPTAGNPERIRILGTWEADNIVKVGIPQLRMALGAKAPETMRFHRLAAEQLKGLWAAWEAAGLLDRVLSYEGSFVPRFVRGSRKTLSNHAFGSAFDINARYNGIGERPALVGQKGSVRELVPLANQWGFWWGGHFENRRDGMHFEVAYLLT